VDWRICRWFKTVERILPCQGGKSIESFRMGEGTIQDIATIIKLDTRFVSWGGGALRFARGSLRGLHHEGRLVQERLAWFCGRV